MAMLKEWFLIATIWIRQLNFSYEDFKILIPFLILLLLLVWWIHRVKPRVKRMVQDEICKCFPLIKEALENLEKRVNVLQLEAERLESRLNELKKK